MGTARETLAQSVVFSGQTNANFCPHGYGCRSLVVSEDQIILDVTDNDLTVVVRVPEGKQLWLVSLSPDQAPAGLEFVLGFLSLECFSPSLSFWTIPESCSLQP